MIKQPNVLPASCLIEVNNKSIKEFHQYIQNVTVKLKRGQSSTASITLSPYRNERGQWSVQDENIFRPWDPIEIIALFGTRQEEIMSGYIREINADYPGDMSAAKVTIEVQDDLIKFDRLQQHSVPASETNERSDGEIIREISEDVGIDVANIAEGLRNKAIHHNKTPIRLMRERAEVNGYELYVRSRSLYFETPALSSQAQPRILAYAGPQTNCLEFTLKEDGHLPDQVSLTREPESSSNGEFSPTVFHPDQSLLGAQALSSEQKGLKPFNWTLEAASGSSEIEAESRAQAIANKNQFKIKAKGKLSGAIYGHVLWPYSPVEVDGIGDTYSGLFYVDEVIHRFTGTGYEQEFTLLKNAIN